MFILKIFQNENIDPAEEINIFLQLSFAYEGEWNRVELDAVSSISVLILCRNIVVALKGEE